MSYQTQWRIQRIRQILHQWSGTPQFSCINIKTWHAISNSRRKKNTPNSTICLPVFCHTSQQRFQPAFSAFTVSIEKSDDLSFHLFGADKASADESWTLVSAQHMNRHGKISYMIFQFFPKIVYNSRRKTNTIKYIFFRKNKKRRKKIQQMNVIPLSLASSTKIISASNSRGERVMMDHTVRSNVDQASLWKTMTILVVGRRPG